MNTRETLKVNNNGVLEIGGVNVTDIIKQHQTPVYVMDLEHVENMCKTFTNSLSTYYGTGLVCYASKAFCCKEIYRIIDKFNMGADVVSAGELYTAKSVDFPSEKIIFHGNNKSKDEIQLALENKIKYFVVDSENELAILNELCKNSNTTQEILVRINPGIEAHTHHYIQTATVDSKFGFSIDNGDALAFLSKIKNYSNVKLVGLHCHIGSQIFESKSFNIAVKKMCAFYKTCKDELDFSFSVLDIGGGFGIYYNENDPKLTFEDYDNYVKTICKTLKESIIEYKLDKPYLILEPGRSIVGEAGITLYTIGSTKEITNVKNYLAIDGGLFENPRFALYQAQYEIVAPEKMNDPKTNVYSIAGKCCESGDLIAENVSLPKMKTGETLAVLSTGAYNYSMSSNYNRNLIPPVIAVKNGKMTVIVKRQGLDDLLRNDI